MGPTDWGLRLLFLECVCGPGRNDLRSVAPAKRAAPLDSLAAHPHALPGARARPREYSRERRRFVRLQSRFIRGCVVAHRLHGPARAVHDVHRDLRVALCEAIRAHSWCHSNLIRTATARDAQIAANRQRGHSRGRRGLHFRRGSNHADRAVVAVSPRDGADHG